MYFVLNTVKVVVKRLSYVGIDMLGADVVEVGASLPLGLKHFKVQTVVVHTINM